MCGDPAVRDGDVGRPQTVLAFVIHQNQVQGVSILERVSHGDLILLADPASPAALAIARATPTAGDSLPAVRAGRPEASLALLARVWPSVRRPRFAQRRLRRRRCSDDAGQHMRAGEGAWRCGLLSTTTDVTATRSAPRSHRASSSWTHRTCLWCWWSIRPSPTGPRPRWPRAGAPSSPSPWWTGPDSGAMPPLSGDGR